MCFIHFLVMNGHLCYLMRIAIVLSSPDTFTLYLVYTLLAPRDSSVQYENQKININSEVPTYILIVGRAQLSNCKHV